MYKIKEQFASLRYEGLLLGKKTNCFVCDFSEEQIVAYLAASPSQEKVFDKIEITNDASTADTAAEEKTIPRTKQTRK